MKLSNYCSSEAKLQLKKVPIFSQTSFRFFLKPIECDSNHYGKESLCQGASLLLLLCSEDIIPSCQGVFRGRVHLHIISKINEGKKKKREKKIFKTIWGFFKPPLCQEQIT